ncbi:restriction endonuclease subunit S [Glutamicibacter sp. 287]|uniref:restriction endonuclease subunit S n=1 Tax=unclassified Glutamicibacter TaxID=2627139 RepID=UPI001596BE6E|nr:restriction endonuclease subunit S [Glutamicibacter sp. BW80]
MIEFKNYKLKELASIITGSTPKASEPDSWGNTIPFITPSDQVDGLRNVTASRYLSPAGRAKLIKRLVPEGATNLTCIGATIGKVTQATEESCTNQQINSLLAKPSICDANFLYYMTSNWSARLKLEASGSATPIVNKTTLGNYEFCVPTLHNQQAIAEVLGALDDKIAANSKLASATDKYLASLFSQTTGGAKEVSLGEIAQVNPDRRTPEDGKTIKYIDIASVGIGMHAPSETIPWGEAPSRARRGLIHGDTIWSTVRPNRRSHSLNLSDDQTLVASTGLAVLRPPKHCIAYVYEATKRPEFTSYLENVAEGSAYPAVRADRFLSAPIPWAEASWREEFEAKAMPLRQLVHTQRENSETLSSLRDSLLPHLMSGTLRVKDAENLVSDAI